MLIKKNKKKIITRNEGKGEKEIKVTIFNLIIIVVVELTRMINLDKAKK